MSTITKEQAKDLRNAFLCWQQDYEPVEDKEQYDMFGLGMVAMDALLASLEAEPVAYADPQAFRNFKAGAARREWMWCNPGEDLIPLFIAPPAPVAVPEAMTPKQASRAYCGEVRGYRDGWNTCRAAMLQGAEHVSNRDEFPLGYLQGHKDGLEWAAQLAEANHPQTGDWLYDDPIALAAAIRKGPDMPELKSASADGDDNFYSWFGRFWLENYQQNNYTTSAKQMLGTMAEFAFRAGRESATQAGNSPTLPDGWVNCSERMPEGMQTVITSNGFDIGQAWWDGEGWNSFDSHDVVPGEVTHWMPLPAAPLQEVK